MTWVREESKTSGAKALTVARCMVTVVTNRFHGPLVRALILTYLAFFSCCIGPVFWTLLPEIFPTDVRGLAMTVPVLTQWVANALVVLLFPFAYHQIGKVVTFGFLAAMALPRPSLPGSLCPKPKINRSKRRGILASKGNAAMTRVR